MCSAHQSVVLLVDAVDWDLTYKDLIIKIVFNPESNKYMMHLCESCPGTAILNEFLDQEPNEHEDYEELINISGTLPVEQHWQPLQPHTKNPKRL